MKLKKILKESNAPGYKDRKFGEVITTLARVQDAYEEKRNDGQMLTIIGNNNVSLRRELREMQKALLFKLIKK